MSLAIRDGLQHYRGHHERSGARPPAGFVYARDRVQASPGQDALVRAQAAVAPWRVANRALVSGRLFGHLRRLRWPALTFPANPRRTLRCSQVSGTAPANPAAIGR